MWFDPPICLKIMVNGKKYHILESFGATAVTGLGFIGPKKWVFMYKYCDRERFTKWILFKFSSFIPWEGEMC